MIGGVNLKNTKQIVNFVLSNISTIRAFCLHHGIKDVDKVIAYFISTSDGRNLDFTNAVKKYTTIDATKIINKYNLGAYNGFFITWNDIKKMKNEIDFTSICYANNLDCNYIKGV